MAALWRQNEHEMSRARSQYSRALVFLSLLLVVLANLGVTIHAGHHTIGATDSGVSTLSLGGHPGPDPTLHLEEATQVTRLTCPGCILQQQIGATHFIDLGSLRRPAIASIHSQTQPENPTSRSITTKTSRGPPSC